jgi:hypothetical protein
MLQFIGGIVLGAIASLVLDRLYRRYERARESRVRVRITSGTFIGIEGEGMRFTIRNLSAASLPPFRIAIFHPDRGTAWMFGDFNAAALLPDQERQFTLNLISSQRKVEPMVEHWFWHAKHQKLDNPTGVGFIFRLVMESSDKVLYENVRIGQTFADVVIRACRNGNFNVMSYQESMALQDLDREYIREQSALLARLEKDRKSAA